MTDTKKIEPFGYFCEWSNRDLNDQRLYYGEPGSGTYDDWNREPDVFLNKPLDDKAALEAARQEGREESTAKLLSWEDGEDLYSYPDDCNVVIVARLEFERMVKVGIAHDQLRAKLAAIEAVSVDLVLWWNGLRKNDQRDLTFPTVSPEEDTYHDIPLVPAPQLHAALAKVAELDLMVAQYDHDYDALTLERDQLRAHLKIATDALEEIAQLFPCPISLSKEALAAIRGEV